MSWFRDAAIAAVTAGAAGGAAAAAVAVGSARLSRKRGDDPEREEHDLTEWEREAKDG